jgi:hypothetical protein
MGTIQLSNAILIQTQTPANQLLVGHEARYRFCPPILRLGFGRSLIRKQLEQLIGTDQDELRNKLEAELEDLKEGPEEDGGFGILSFLTGLSKPSRANHSRWIWDMEKMEMTTLS